MPELAHKTLEKCMPPLGQSTETVPKRRTEREFTTEPPYKVILHNDDYTPMEHVIKVLRKVIPRMNLRQAVSIRKTSGLRAWSPPSSRIEFSNQGWVSRLNRCSWVSAGLLGRGDEAR